MPQAQTTGPVVIDSRKFIGQLNDSVQSKLTFFESKIRDMGRQAGKRWTLVSLLPNTLYIKEEDSNRYYTAKHHTEGRRVVVEGVSPLKIVEQQKQQFFNESCMALVNAVETNDQKAMSAAFNGMKTQRFSSRIIPPSGTIRSRDGRTHFIPVAGTAALDEQVRPQLVAAIVENLKDQVIVEDGRVVGGTFNDGAPIKLPITRWSMHKLVARQMRETARDAYWSAGFRKRVYGIARLVYEDKIEEAVKAVTPFLKEEEEFTLLSRKEMTNLVENALAAVGLFNQELCDNTALLLYRTNLKINRNTIIKEWTAVARRAQHPSLLRNVKLLGESKHFERSYESFLSSIFEAIGNREVTAGALATTLEVLRDRTPKIRESHELASKLNDLIDRLKEKDFDDNAVFEAEDFLATVQEELATGDDLQNFDQMPGGDGGGMTGGDAQEAGDDLADSLSDDADQKQPQIVINAPLISIGGGDGGAAAGGGLGDDMGGGDEDIDSLLGGADNQEQEGQDDLLAAGQAAGKGGMGLESRRRGRAVSEEWDEEKYGKKPWEKDGDDNDGDDDKDGDDDDDPYSFGESAGEFDLSIGHDYGAPAITNSDDVRRVVQAMVQLAGRNNLTGRRLQENAEKLALAGLEAAGMRVPERKQSAAVDQVLTAFMEEVEQDDEDWGENWKDGDDGRKRIPGLDETEDFDETPPEPEADGPAEAQYKWGTKRLRRRARRRSEYATAHNESNIRWIEAQDDAILGEMAGVRFIFDHGGSDPNTSPVILSEDGTREIPIPDQLYDSAFAAARMVKGYDHRPFQIWLASSIEQLRPLSEEEMGFGPEDDDEYGNQEYDATAGDMDGDGDVDAEDDMLATQSAPDMGGGYDSEMGGEYGDGADEMDGGMDDEMVGDEGELEGAVTRITATGDGGLSVEVTPGTRINEIGGGDGDMGGGMEDGDGMDDGMEGDMGGGGMDGGMDDDGMEPVDSVEPQDAEGDGPGDTVAGDDESAMPDFEGGDEGPPRRRRPDDEGLGEDEDITQPRSGKYTAEVNKNKREVPDAKLPPKSDDKLKGFEGLKKGNKSGSDHPTSKSRSDD